MIAARAAVAFVALEHLAFMALEMFLWRTPTGLRVFGMTAAQAESSAVLAANQGLYNGMLAAGLIASFFTAPATALALRTYILTYIAVVGAYGAWTVSPRILLVQTLPAVLALAAVRFAR